MNKMQITNEDNLDLMNRYEDNHFDLAIVDPPYGILNKTKRGGDYKFNMDEYSKWDIKPKSLSLTSNITRVLHILVLLQ